MAPAGIGDSGQRRRREQRAEHSDIHIQLLRSESTRGRREVKMIPEAAVSATAWKLKHPEHYEGSVRRSEKKWHKRAT